MRRGLVSCLAVALLGGCGGTPTAGGTEPGPEMLIDDRGVAAAFDAAGRPLSAALPADPRVPDICTLFDGNDFETSDLTVFYVFVFRTHSVAMEYAKVSAYPGEKPAGEVRRIHNVVIYLPKVLSRAARRDVAEGQRGLRARATQRDPDSVCDYSSWG